MPNVAEFEADLGFWKEGVDGAFRAPQECCQNWCKPSGAGWTTKCGWDPCKMCSQCGSEAMSLTCGGVMTSAHVVATPETCEEIQQLISADKANVDELGVEASDAIAI